MCKGLGSLGTPLSPFVLLVQERPRLPTAQRPPVRGDEDGHRASTARKVRQTAFAPFSMREETLPSIGALLAPSAPSMPPLPRAVR